MSNRRNATEARRFTFEEFRSDRSRVVTAAKEERGAIVVDEKGQRIYSIWIPQGPIGDD
jgi:hypothetical protein